MIAARIALIFAMIFSVADAQFGNNNNNNNNYNVYAEKAGSCPPPLSVNICKPRCYSDAHCRGIAKCCPTSCGGTLCSFPVTMRSQETLVKPGSCPSVPTGAWICSSTCTYDSDCRGTTKCCRNRCGAFVCQKPGVEVIESVEIPFNPQPDTSYNDIPTGNNNPFLVYSN